jgi:hypothetical protein
MPFKRHPSHSLLLSALNGTAASERDDVSAHLAVCARCRSVANRYGAVLKDLSESGAARASRRPQSQASPPPVRTIRFPKAVVIKAAAGALAAGLLLMMFGWTRHIQTVSASEILSRVEAAQSGAPGTRHFYRLRMGGATCNTVDAAWGGNATLNGGPCARAHVKLLQTHWNDREMLSARSYRQWHDGLSQHHDSVSREEPYWTIQTDTDQGALRSASLRIRSSDYRPVELTLKFAAFDPISVVEDEPSEQRVEITGTNSGGESQIGERRRTLQNTDDDPADAVEVEAWRILRNLGADSGWEATVARNGSKVSIAGFVGDSARRTSLADAFSKLPGVAVDLDRPASLPRRVNTGDSRPLAETRVEALIPDAQERGDRITEISNASQAVVGKAFLYDRLLRRQHDLGERSSVALNSVVEGERADLLTAMNKLSNLLEPFPEMRGTRAAQAPLSYAQAQSLDAGILSLFNAAPKQSASLQATTNRVRSLLPR